MAAFGGLSGSLSEVKKSFFDRVGMLDKLDAMERRALSKFGAFVRTRDIRSQRKRKAVSDPGTPPSAHAGTIRKLTFFAYDARRRSVVIGPLVFAAKGPRGGPALIEYGGRVLVAPRPGRPGGLLNYRARPHTGPAFRAELPKAAGLFAGQFGKR